MIRQQAFGEKKMLKGVTHFHTTRSDGKVDPGDAIRIYHQHGYDFVAMTDHRVYNFKNYAPEVPMTIIPGMEYDCTHIKDEWGFKCFHTVTIGPLKEDGNPHEQDQFFDKHINPTQGDYQYYLDGFEDKGQLTIHCHPHWSSTPPNYFKDLKGITAFEVYNHVCNYESREDFDNGAYWDELLGKGKVLWGVASDDAHRPEHYCGGWIMVNADNNVNSILDAIRKGKFYASTGPVINDFYIDDEGNVHVDCEEAALVSLHCDKHPGKTLRPQNGEEFVTHVTHNIMDGDFKWEYVRACVVGKDGKLAWTNPIFLNEQKFGEYCQK